METLWNKLKTKENFSEKELDTIKAWLFLVNKLFDIEEITMDDYFYPDEKPTTNQCRQVTDQEMIEVKVKMYDALNSQLQILENQCYSIIEGE